MKKTAAARGATTARGKKTAEKVLAKETLVLPEKGAGAGAATATPDATEEETVAKKPAKEKGGGGRSCRRYPCCSGRRGAEGDCLREALKAGRRSIDLQGPITIGNGGDGEHGEAFFGGGGGKHEP